MRRTLLAVPACLLLAACTSGPSPAPVPGATVPGATGPSATGPSAAAATDSPGAASPVATLRERLRLPALPAFSLPTDVLATPRDQDLSDRLRLQPGLYEGIVVLSARCEAGSEPRPADTGAEAPSTSAAASWEDATRSVTVHADGTGVYDAPGLHVAVLPDGSGVYEDGTVRLTVQRGGAGTWESGERRLTVRADGSGSYQDGQVRLWVGPDGAGGYDDEATHVSLAADGTVQGSGEPAAVALVEDVLRDRLPRFPPVPRLGRVTPAGTACGTVVRLDANVLFDVAQASLRPEAAELLGRVGALLVALGQPAAQVVGHTDTVGTAEDNQALSERRAAAVRDELLRQGVSADALSARGLGEERPVRPDVAPDGTEDPAARQLNRRVELVLADS